MKRTPALLLSLFIVGACVNPTVHKYPSTAVDFRKFGTVSFSVRDSLDEYSADEREHGLKMMELLRTLLEHRLTKNGYTVVEANANPSLAIDVNVTSATLGNEAARFLIGFGAGRALFKFDATFSEGDRLIAGFSGGQSYTGIELKGKSFATETEIQTVAALEAVNQIETFMKNGGRFSTRSATTTR